MRAVTGARILGALALVLGWMVVAPTSVGGSSSYVTTHGISMEPRFHTGDLAVVRAADDYHVRDVVAYHSELLDTVVLHRIVAIHGEHYTFKGDNNTWLDHEQPSERQLIGKLALRVPRGGVWLERLTSPAALGLLAFGLVATAGTATVRRGKRHRGRRTATVSTHANRRRRASSGATTSSPQLAAAMKAAGALCLVGLALACFAWTVPATEAATVGVDTTRSVRFSYSADVPPTAAYDGTTVHSPDPVFRRLTRSMRVRFAYQGPPGTVSVATELSAANGWHSRLQLTSPKRFTGRTYAGRVTLDLAALDRRAAQAAAAIGMPIEELTVQVTPTFRSGTATAFAPALVLHVTPDAVSVTGSSALAMTDTATTPTPTTEPRVLALAGRQMTVHTARTLSAVLVLVGVAGLLLARAVGRWTAPATEGAAIRRAYAANLLRVAPMAVPSHRPLVDVHDFETLANVAERYGLLILHWARADVETFLVYDDSASYRYRTGNGVDVATAAPPDPSVVADGTA